MQVFPNIRHIHSVSVSSNFLTVSTLILFMAENEGEEAGLTFNDVTSIHNLITLVVKTQTYRHTYADNIMPSFLIVRRKKTRIFQKSY